MYVLNILSNYKILTLLINSFKRVEFKSMSFNSKNIVNISNVSHKNL